MTRHIASASRVRPARNCKGVGIAVLVAAFAGCGSSDDAKVLPDAAKKSLVQKKVDVSPRPSTTKPSRP
jgi:hypothetical protein